MFGGGSPICPPFARQSSNITQKYESNRAKQGQHLTLDLFYVYPSLSYNMRRA